MIGKTISHYKILEKLGEGGMGVVYKAEDTKLKREVAIKFLAHHIAGDSTAMERFKIEAQATAALNHPNIATIHAIEGADDETFIVMEYLKRKSLKEKIESGPIEISEALDIAIQISQGLTKAHEKGIIHRDIKPSNIVISDDGVAKILDFGLAKIAAGSIVTREGTTLGTAAYMSPEQAQGESIDHRTDIWSLGVVLYEMITGQLPFKADYELAIVYLILNVEPQPVSEVRSDVPPTLEKAIHKALAKNMLHRYQNADEMIVDLRAIKNQIDSGTPPSPKIEHDELDTYHEFIDPRIASHSIYCNIFLDASLSMKGFIQAEMSTNYMRTVKELEHTLIRAWTDYQVKYYRFGAVIKRITRDGFRKATTLKFYESPEVNRDTCIYSIFEKDQYFNPETLSIVLTDLFEHGSDIDYLLHKIKKTVYEQGLSIGVLGVKSQFSGIIDNITERSHTIRYQTKGTGSYRPFYILLFGTYGNILKYYEKLKEGFLKQCSIELSQFTIFTREVLFPPISYTDSQLLSMSQIAVSSGGKLKIKQLVKILKLIDGPGTPSMVYRFKLNYLPHVIISYFDNICIKLRAKNIKRNSFVNDLPISQSIVLTKSNCSFSSFDLKVKIDWEMLREELPYFCIVDLQPTVNYNGLPNWFRDWDMKEANLASRLGKGNENLGSQTYNLHSLLRSLAEIYIPFTQQIYFILKR